MFENVGICFQNVVVFALLVLPGWISKKTGLIGYCRLRRSRIEIRKVLVFCAVFNNTGFIGMPFRSLFESKEVWETVLWRLVLIPGLCLGMLYLLWPDNVLVNTVMVLMFAMPTASTSCVVVEQYGQDVAFATRCILVSTLFMAVTVPLWYGLITYML